MRNNLATQLLSDLSHEGRRGVTFKDRGEFGSEDVSSWIPEQYLAAKQVALPEVTEPEVIRHYTNLSTLNMSVDTHFYPLGSCTMKYNPKRNERVASMPGMLHLHPLTPDCGIQGMLEMLYELEGMLAEVSGLPAVSLQPAAGAHGELTALMAAAAYFRDRGEKRTQVLAPDSAHGTNPASATMAGFTAVTVKSCDDGSVDIDDLKSKLTDEVAVFMITNPNTLGLFDGKVREVADLVHAKGGLIYLDGANMNAILGKARPGDFGADMMHFNPHKTFSGPHGGGGPGAGPICVREFLRPFLPVPRVIKTDSGYKLCSNQPKTIGKVRSFFGNVGVLVRAYAYIRTHGPEGLRRVSEHAVLNANYMLSQLKHTLTVPHGDRCMHEFVASAEGVKKSRGLSAMDIAKRLLDFGFHAPTVYFPLTVPEAMMIEPTETESKETMDAFCAAIQQIISEDAGSPTEFPMTTPISRPDEVTAARKPVVKWIAVSS